MRRPRGVRTAGSLLVLLLAAVLSLATSAPRSARRYPTWRAEPVDHVVDGAVVAAWVSRSGREGVGVSVEIDPKGTGLTFEVDPAATTLRIGRRTVRPLGVLRAPSPPDRARRYLPFAFDGLTAWNTGQHRAVLHLAVRGPAATRTLVVWLTHSLESPHVTMPPGAPP